MINNSPLLTILYQDEYIVAIHKPSGLLVHRSMLDKHETQFAVQILRGQIGKYVYPVHRLDRPTSGVLVFALSSDIARALNEQFVQQNVEKEYLAVVRGFLVGSATIDYGLKEKLDKIADKMAKQDKDAQSAITHYQGLGTFEMPFAVRPYNTSRYSLVRLSPKTGRKHQLRRHMAHIRHPILGDTTHGDGKHNLNAREKFDFTRLALTCNKMSIIHPVTGNELVIQTTLDSDMHQLLQQFGCDEKSLTKLGVKV